MTTEQLIETLLDPNVYHKHVIPHNGGKGAGGRDWRVEIQIKGYTNTNKKP